jgi:hypothetical protein
MQVYASKGIADMAERWHYPRTTNGFVNKNYPESYDPFVSG